MTRDKALDRARKLLALAAPGSGASSEEARSAAVTAAALIVEHALLDGGSPSTIDLGRVANLALRVIELEHMLIAERAAHEADRRSRDERWRTLLEEVRTDERRAAYRSRKLAAKQAVRDDRTNLAAAGGRGRARNLSNERKREIARTAAQERWRRWRERQGAEPR